MKISSETNKIGPDKTFVNKWDKYLVDYNNYTKEYIKHYKKSIEGDTVSFRIYPYLKAKSELLFEKLFDAQKKTLLSQKQIKRMNQIQIKIATPCLT